MNNLSFLPSMDCSRVWYSCVQRLPIWQSQKCVPGFPGAAVIENLPANAGDTGSSPGLGRSHMLRSNEAREPQLLSPRAATTEAGTSRGSAPQQEKPPQ